MPGKRLRSPAAAPQQPLHRRPPAGASRTAPGRSQASHRPLQLELFGGRLRSLSLTDNRRTILSVKPAPPARPEPPVPGNCRAHRREVREVLADGGERLPRRGAALGAAEEGGDRPQHRIGRRGEGAVDAQVDRRALAPGLRLRRPLLPAGAGTDCGGARARRRTDREDGAAVVGQR